LLHCKQQRGNYVTSLHHRLFARAMNLTGAMKNLATSEASLLANGRCKTVSARREACICRPHFRVGFHPVLHNESASALCQSRNDLAGNIAHQHRNRDCHATLSELCGKGAWPLTAPDALPGALDARLCLRSMRSIVVHPDQHLKWFVLIGAIVFPDTLASPIDACARIDAPDL
jgi:hypothetical protein